MGSNTAIAGLAFEPQRPTNCGAEGEALDIVDTDAAVLCEKEAEVRVETRGGRVLRLAFRSATGALDQVSGTCPLFAL